MRDENICAFLFKYLVSSLFTISELHKFEELKTLNFFFNFRKHEIVHKNQCLILS